MGNSNTTNNTLDPYSSTTTNTWDPYSSTTGNTWEPYSSTTTNTLDPYSSTTTTTLDPYSSTTTNNLDSTPITGSTTFLPPYHVTEKYVLSVAVMTIFIIMMGMLIYYTVRWWYPEDFGGSFSARRRANRNRTRGSSISTITIISQDKPPTYDEILTSDNMEDPPTYNEALQQFAELQYLPDDERIGCFFHLPPPPYRRPTITSDVLTTVTVSSFSDGWSTTRSSTTSGGSISVIVVEEGTRL